MVNDRMFLRCSICGNIVGMVQDAGITPVCCGEDMTLLTANTTDASKEKHVPAVKRNGNEISVSVGEATHPMSDAHHIAWIAIACNNHTQRAVLPHTEEPNAVFYLTKNEPVTVYAYCNLHGLWACEA